MAFHVENSSESVVKRTQNNEPNEHCANEISQREKARYCMIPSYDMFIVGKSTETEAD